VIGRVTGCLTIAAGALTAIAGALPAQRPAEQPAPARRTVEGRVLRGSAARETPVAGQMVVLHRIAADSAGPLDSMPTGRDGRYRFAYRASGDDGVYIVSARYSGVAYFTPPLVAADARGDAAAIVVFDTTSAPIPLQVRGRHLVVTAPDPGGARRAVDVFEIANDTSLTRVAAAGAATWSTRLPAEAERFEVGRGDVSAEGVRFSGDSAHVIAPFAPGSKQLVFRYVLPPAAFPLQLPLAAGVGVLEVLIEDPAARVEAPGVARQEAVSLEGRTYQRYLAEDVPVGTALRVIVGDAPRARVWLPVLAILAAAGAMALGARAGRRARAVAAPPSDAGSTPDAIAAAIAALDNAVDAQPDAAAARATHEERRAELEARLADALAAATPPR
jgi:hypothetical protein